MAFYPVSMTEQPAEIDAYLNKERTKEGVKLSMGSAMSFNHVFNRKVNGLVQHGPIAPEFTSG
jgi:hypothetical protein